MALGEVKQHRLHQLVDKLLAAVVPEEAEEIGGILQVEGDGLGKGDDELVVVVGVGLALCAQRLHPVLHGIGQELAHGEILLDLFGADVLVPALAAHGFKRLVDAIDVDQIVAQEAMAVGIEAVFRAAVHV